MYEVARYMAGLLKPHIWHKDFYIKKNSASLAQLLDMVTLELGDLLVSLDMESFYKDIPGAHVGTVAASIPGTGHRYY